jgi:hypothetical protein
MIKLKDILFEATAPDIFVPRRMDDRIERMIKDYIRNGSKGNLELSNMNLIELPAILKDITVSGHFICSNNKLTSLNNSPKTVGGYFGCGNNNLTSLVGAPTSVGGAFNCGNNSVQFTEAQVRAVCDVKKKVYV